MKMLLILANGKGFWKDLSSLIISEFFIFQKVKENIASGHNHN